MAMPWLRVLVTGISPRILGLNSRSVNARFVVEKRALGRIAFWDLRSIFSVFFEKMFRTHIHLHIAVTRRTQWRSQDNIQKQSSFEIGEKWLENYFPLFFYLEATKHSPFHVVSSWFLVFLSPGITVSSHSYSFMLSLHFFRSHVRNIMKLLT